MGVKPGKAMGGLLAGLFDRVLEDPSLNTPETLKTLAKERLGGGK